MESDKGSGDLSATEDVRTQVLSPDLVAGDVLNSGPPLRVQESGVSHPIGNGLLTDRGSVEVIGDGLCERSLASGDRDRALKGGNVSVFHKERGYTNRFVSVNQPVCVTQNKNACKVVDMALVKKKQQPKTAKRREAVPGVDGKTLGQRVAEAMAYESGRRRTEYRQADLLADVNHLAGAREENPVMTQQMLSAIMVGKVSRSSLTPLIAAACHVNAVWLGDGAAKMLD